MECLEVILELHAKRRVRSRRNLFALPELPLDIRSGRLPDKQVCRFLDIQSNRFQEVQLDGLLGEKPGSQSDQTPDSLMGDQSSKLPDKLSGSLLWEQPERLFDWLEVAIDSLPVNNPVVAAG